MAKFTYVVQDNEGIHARPAGMLAKEGKNYKSTVTITKAGKSAEITRLLAVMSLGVKCGETVEVSVEGEDEETAFEEVKAFFEANL